MKVTQAKIARALGLSRKTMTVWKRRGLLVMAGDTVDLVATRQQLLASHEDGPALVARLDEISAVPVTPASEAVTLLPPGGDLVVTLAYRLMAHGALTAVDAGVPVSTAQQIDHQFRVNVMAAVADLLTEMDPTSEDWTRVPIWDQARMPLIDWSRV